MRTFILFIFGLLLITSCRQGINKNSITEQSDSLKSSINNDLSNEIKIDTSLKLDFIVPYKIFGCGGGGYFTYESTKITSKTLIFLSSLNEDSAIIKVNGKEIYLLPDTLNIISRQDSFFQDAWKGHGLSVILKVNVLNETGDEMKCKGTMEIKNSISKIKFNIHGGYED